MRYWDSSALIPLWVNEPSTPRIASLLQEDDEIATWWGTRIECFAALWRIGRIDEANTAEIRSAAERLRKSIPDWTTIDPSEDLVRRAERLLRIHPLRAGDA